MSILFRPFECGLQSEGEGKSFSECLTLEKGGVSLLVWVTDGISCRPAASFRSDENDGSVCFSWRQTGISSYLVSSSKIPNRAREER